MANFVFASFSRLPTNDTNHKYIMVMLSPSLSAWILCHNGTEASKAVKRDEEQTENSCDVPIKTTRSRNFPGRFERL